MAGTLPPRSPYSTPPSLADIGHLTSMPFAISLVFVMYSYSGWNAAVYVAQIDDERLGRVVGERKYLDATREVLRAHGGLWFMDESYVVSRKRG